LKELLVWLGPERPAELVTAVERAGGRLVDAPDAKVIVWSATEEGPEALRNVLHDGVALVQLDSAGVEHWFDAGVVDDGRIWAAAQGSFAGGVAEHALALLLAAVKRLPQAATARTWGAVPARLLRGATVGIVGAGGIGERLIELLAPFGVTTVALTRSGRDVAGATRSLGPDRLHELLAASDYAVLGAPLTDETRRMIGARELELIGPEGGLVNCARGGLVDTDALVAALRDGQLGVACLDVTDPEPLPDGHPLWELPNALVTPHVSYPWGAHYGPLAERIEENLRRFAAGRPLLGVVDPKRGY
jgi:phosphoglycerate dehydrogenase-like enzyme